MSNTQITPQLLSLLKTVIMLRRQERQMEDRGRGRKSERLGIAIEISKAEVAFLVAAGQLESKTSGISEVARTYLNDAIDEYNASLPARP